MGMIGNVNSHTTVEGGEMDTILQNCAIDELPVMELAGVPGTFVEPVPMHLPEK